MPDLPNSVDDIEIKHVERGSSQEWDSLDTKQKQQMLLEAKQSATTIYGGRLSRVSRIRDRVLFTINLTRHYWQQAEGGDAQSESATGGSTSYNTVTGEAMRELTTTRYGQRALEMIRDDMSTGIVRTHR